MNRLSKIAFRPLALPWLIQVSVQASSPTVVINEIQVSGGTAKEEFVELYNPSEQPINLAGWRLAKKTASGNQYNLLTAFPDSQIASQGYFLIAPPELSGSQTVNLQYSTSQSLADNNTLILYSDGGETMVDMVGWGETTYFEGTPAGNPKNGQSLSRLSADTDNNFADFKITNPTPGQVNSAALSNGAPSDTSSNNNDSSNSNQPDDEISGEEPTDSTPENQFPSTGKIILNELLPNPADDEVAAEWIELKNIDQQTVDVTGWQVADKTKSYTVKSTDVSNPLINPGGFLILPRQVTNLALNNTVGETVTLLDGGGRTVDTISFIGSAPENQSWAKLDSGNWAWTIKPTKGSENIIEAEPKAPAKEKKINPAPKTTTSSPTKTPTVITDDDLFEQKFQVETSDTDTAAVTDTAANYEDLILNELLPNPEGSDSEEWLELFNRGSQELALSDFYLGDASGKIQKLSEDIIASGGYLVVKGSTLGLSLNNNGDEIKLWSPNKYLIGQTKYVMAAKTGEAYARNDNGFWEWTNQPTPGAKNIFTQTPTTAAKGKVTTASAGQVNDKSTPAVLMDIASAKQQKMGAVVAVKGQISAAPGQLAKTYFYIFDGNAGIKIYTNKSIPDFPLGTWVRISGTLTESDEELRINLKSITQDAEEKPEALDPLTITLNDIDEPLEGALVTTKGEIASVKGSNVYLTDEEAEARVYLATATGISATGWQTGDRVQVTGLVSQTKTGYRLLPRQQDDIVNINGQVAGASTTASAIIVKNRAEAQPIWLYIIITLIALLAALAILNHKFGWLKLHPGYLPKPPRFLQKKDLDKH